MCTAIRMATRHHLFGRTLDLEKSYGEGVVVTPRNYRFKFCHAGDTGKHPAIIGMACVRDGYPLYFDAMNEHGLSIAALNFPKSAVYRETVQGKTNVASYELIPWLLSNAKSVRDAARLLSNVNVTGDSVAEDMPSTPLHWMIADRGESVVVEAVDGGLRVYENRFDVLTNEPPFPYHEAHVAEYMHLTSSHSRNVISPDVELLPYSRGMGAIGLPGDFSSASRFVRAFFAKSNVEAGGSLVEEISAFFHIMGTVSTPSGCVMSENGDPVRTVYTSCADMTDGTYYFTTYENRRVRAVRIRDAEDEALSVFDISGGEDILVL